MKDSSDVGKTILRRSAAAWRSATLMELALAPKSQARVAFSCSSASFPAPPPVALKIDAPWPQDSMLTPATTRDPMSQAKAGVTVGAVVVAAPASKQRATNAFCRMMRSWAVPFPTASAVQIGGMSDSEGALVRHNSFVTCSIPHRFLGVFFLSATASS